MEWSLLFFIGLIAGTFGSLVGLGGGVITVPSLIYADSTGLLTRPLTHQNAVGISLMVIIFTAISSTLYNYKQKKVDLKSGLFFFSASGPAAIIGSIISEYLQVKQFYLLFGIVMIIITYLLSVKNKIAPRKINWDVSRDYIDASGNSYHYGYNKTSGFLVTAIAGLLAGLFGIGGGAILVPMMVILFNFPPHVAVATSMFIILMSASVGSIAHIIQGNIIFIYVLIIGTGAYIGGRLGAYISTKISSKTLIVLLRLIIVLIAGQMIYKGIF